MNHPYYIHQAVRYFLTNDTCEWYFLTMLPNDASAQKKYRPPQGQRLVPVGLQETPKGYFLTELLKQRYTEHLIITRF